MESKCFSKESVVVPYICILFNTYCNVCTLQLCICAFSELTLLYLLQLCPNFNFFSRRCKQHPASNPNEPALVPCKLVLAKKTSPLQKISLKILDYFETLNYFETIWLFRRESCLEGEGFVSRGDIKRHHCWHHPSHPHHHHAEHDHDWCLPKIIKVTLRPVWPEASATPTMFLPIDYIVFAYVTLIKYTYLLT